MSPAKRIVRSGLCTAGGAAFLMIAASLHVQADDKAAAAAKSNDNGKYLDGEGVPTYHIAADGTVDWYTYNGYRRFNSECNVCHGGDGSGSTFAPSLIDSLKSMNYTDFMQTVAGGRKNFSAGKENVMPSFAENKNVACYMDDIYIYLRARADGALGRGRPDKKESKPEQAKEQEQSCMGLGN